MCKPVRLNGRGGVLQSEYVIIPRGQQLTSFTPTGVNGLTFTAKYGVVGLTVVQKEFIAEGINEAGLSAGLFFFPHYGGYETYDAAQNRPDTGRPSSDGVDVVAVFHYR